MHAPNTMHIMPFPSCMNTIPVHPIGELVNAKQEKEKRQKIKCQWNEKTLDLQFKQIVNFWSV